MIVSRQCKELEKIPEKEMVLIAYLEDLERIEAKEKELVSRKEGV